MRSPVSTQGPESDDPNAAPKTRVLVVDDSAIVGMAMQILLEAKGLEVLTADSCAGALQVIKNESLALVVIDEFLPDGRGSTLVPHLRRLQPRARVVFITATEQVGDFARISQQGVDAIFTKPVDSALFLERINELLPRPPVATTTTTATKSPASVAVDSKNPFGSTPYLASRFPTKAACMVELRRRLSRVLEFQGSVALSGHPGAPFARIAREFHESSSLARTPFLLVSGPFPSESEVREQIGGAEVRVGPVTLCLLRPQGLLDDDLERMAKLKFEGLAGGKVRTILCTTQEVLDELEQSGMPIGLQLASLSFEVPRLQEVRSDLVELARTLLRESGRSSASLSAELEAEAASWIEEAAWDGDFVEFEQVVLLAQKRAHGSPITRSGLVKALQQRSSGKEEAEGMDPVSA